VELKKGRKEKVATSEMVKDEKFLFSLEERGIKATAERYGMSYGRVHYIVRAYGLKFKVLLRGWEKDAPPDFCVKGRCEG